MRLILMGILVFSFSSIFAQTYLSQSDIHKLETKYFNEYHYNGFVIVPPEKVLSHNYSLINLSGQAIVGSALAVGFSILPLTAVFGDAWSGKSTDASQTVLGVLTLSSYLFGAAVGVHWVAKSQNSKLSFWGTVGYSIIGGGVGAILASVLATQYTTIPTVGGSIAALCPIIGAMIYASFISDWPQEPQRMSFYENGLSQKDLFEHSKLFNIELFRIKL